MKQNVIGILAHVDAGKTTLAEAMLYLSGKIRRQGKIDSKNTLMDFETVEKERGITVFSSQAVIKSGETRIYLLDTPGHIDFSAETERTLNILDYAVLVISGISGVQSHTKTLWKLLSVYNIPTFVFVTKMDFARLSEEEILSGIHSELTQNCVSFSNSDFNTTEELAVCNETMLEEFLTLGKVSTASIIQAISKREIFPCFFGSGLKLDGVNKLLDALDIYTENKIYPNEFGAKVYKITHDTNGGKIVHIKITGGELKVRDSIEYSGRQEKVAQIRIYNGAKFESAETAPAGSVCAVTGLTELKSGDALGISTQSLQPLLEPVMSYNIIVPESADMQSIYTKLKEIEEEEPLLHITYNIHIRQIHAELMGEVQAEILKSIVKERYNFDINFDEGKVLYKETITNTVEGVGHYEPLRHYAEVHILIEPLPKGSGIQYASVLSEDILDRNWQRLILMHLKEKQHLGVLTGSPVTDVKFTLAAGKAHLKHTEGGDFRQATYRAVRHGLMCAKSRLLEPYYAFTLEIPINNLGRAITDIKLMSGFFDPPEQKGDVALIKGICPVVTLNGYAKEVASYTGGKGRIQYIPAGYDICHNEKEVISELNYIPNADLENTPDSVFCAHGAGFNVKWDKVTEYMHLDSCIKSEKPVAANVNYRKFSIDEKELEAIMEREFGKVKYDIYRPVKPAKPLSNPEPVELRQKKSYIIIDGYNVIFAWAELKELAEFQLEAARDRLIQLLCNYAAFTKQEVILVFDAYNINVQEERRFNYNNIHIVFTRENELADIYIEKLIAEIGKNEKVRIVTSDNLIKLTAVEYGVIKVSAADFKKEIDGVQSEINDFIAEMKLKTPKNEIIELN